MITGNSDVARVGLIARQPSKVIPTKETTGAGWLRLCSANDAPFDSAQGIPRHLRATSSLFSKTNDIQNQSL